MKQENAHAIPPKRNSTRLAPHLDKRLLAYAAAASAAGVGLLVQPANAKVVYTPANVPIPQQGGGIHLDLNNDGVSDFVFYNSFADAARPPEGNFQSFFIAYGSQAGNSVWAVESKGVECAALLPKEAQVRAGRPFQPEAVLFTVAGSATRGDSSHCKWHAAHHGAFLGLEFVVDGKTHYGWARLTFAANTAPVLNGYAYETVPNKPILTQNETTPPEHAAMACPAALPVSQAVTLGLLAEGSHGLAVWRKPEEEESASLIG